jgi:hypothetical protein
LIGRASVFKDPIDIRQHQECIRPQFAGQQSAGVVFFNDSLYANRRAVVAVHYGNATAACADHNDVLVQQQSDHIDFQNPFRKWGRHREAKNAPPLPIFQPRTALRTAASFSL